LIEVARLGARDLVKLNWPAIQTVARELLCKKKLSGTEVKAIVLRCDKEYYVEVDRSLGLV